MNETQQIINHLANERLDLYRLAGRQQLNTSQIARIQEITNRLPLLWDQMRRELASNHHHNHMRAIPENRRAA